MLVTHDEAMFNANDARSYGWPKDNQVPLRPKVRGKGIMVSAFLTRGGTLAVPESVPMAAPRQGIQIGGEMRMEVSSEKSLNT